jgi:hypothetical protein
MMIEQGRDDSIQETADANAQLATATASDRSTVATLTTTNAKLANQLEAAHALITRTATGKNYEQRQSKKNRASISSDEDR